MGTVKVIKSFEKEYFIPCFQREYSWEVKEIEELIDDIYNSKDKYCIGVTTVNQNNDKYVLIDGQQRLTTIYMIAIACGFIKNENQINLTYEVDEITNKKNSLKELLKQNNQKDENILYDKYRLIENTIEKYGVEKMRSKLENVYFYEINIDKDEKDLNHYFEVMNSRGVQLSRSDMIKAKLISKINENNNAYKKRINNLWNEYEKMSIKGFDKFKSVPYKNEYKELTINQMLNQKNSIVENNKNEEIENENSILDFEYFLLYTIRLYRSIILHKENDNKLFELKDLVGEYDETFKQSNEQEVLDFLDFLIKTKNIYDEKIIRRDNESSSEDDKWILNNKDVNKDIIRIQSCLRVSFTDRKQMKWLFETLKFFHNNGKNQDYVNYIRSFIRNEYIRDFISLYEKEKCQTGFETQRIVLNYLDYLILINKDNISKTIPLLKELDLSNFQFKFRNSIEHFLSRENDDKEKNSHWVHDFGNLALLAYGTNTKMQNATPSNKANYFKNNIDRYSIKLQLMTKLTLKDEVWDENKCKYLRDKLYTVLIEDYNKEHSKL